MNIIFSESIALLSISLKYIKLKILTVLLRLFYVIASKLNLSSGIDTTVYLGDKKRAYWHIS